MITTIEYDRIKEVLGNQYTAAILKHLKKLEIVNSDGKEYSKASIRKFVTGDRENLDIELEIMKLVKVTESKKTALQNKRKKLSNK